jgi:hypothetical protein
MVPDGGALLAVLGPLRLAGAGMGYRFAPMDFAPTLASAQKAHRAGELAAWCQLWLRGEGGNLGLAEPLRDRDDDVYVLAELDLGDVCPITGPEEDFDWPEPPDQFERQVEGMVESLQAGWDAPPLFVHMHTLRLVDGSHRREALLRTGSRTYWAVMWCRRPPFNGRGQQVSLDT